MQQATHRKLRLFKRFNGFIQWLVALLSIILLCHMICRFVRLRSAPRNISADNATSAAGKRAGRAPQEYREALKTIGQINTTPENSARKLEEIITNRVYAPYQFFLGMIPSLGFIGTVLGMGEALLRADRLFTARTSLARQAAINEITQQLGFAFDTTFMALFCSIIVGIALVLCRHKEYDYLEKVYVCIHSDKGNT